MTAGRVETDVLIVGAGAAGLYATLHLPPSLDVLVVDKGKRGQGSSPWAQGGVAAALGPEDTPDLHAEDTMRVAAGHADPAAVAVLCNEAPECVLDLAELGAAFDRDREGGLHLSREGGQSVARSAHAADATGAAIMKALRRAVRPRVTRIEGRCVRLAVVAGRCAGGWILTPDGLVEVRARSTVLATGGVGGIFSATTNPAGATGDGLVVAWEAGAGMSDMEFVQFHPTALAVDDRQQRPLITEALRGAGAYVVDAEGRRFLFEHHSDGELAPRDVVARAISARRAWLDCRHLDAGLIKREFPTVLHACVDAGIDPFTDLIPVAPAAHYFIGGIQTDLDGRSSIPRLYAIGECSNTGAHGANRLAGNSLAEALVFGRRAARAIAGQRAGRLKAMPEPPDLVAGAVPDPERWDRLRSTCTAFLGMEREATQLARVEAEVEELTLLPLPAEPALLELRAAAIVAHLIARAASLRRESRGVHYRRDHPSPEPAWAGMRLRLAKS